MSGKPLEKEFWLGGTADKHGKWSWTDESDWGEPELALASLKDPKKGECLTSKFSFLEIALPDIPTAGHWKAEDCKKPLPAIYKVSTLFLLAGGKQITLWIDIKI